MATLPCQRNGVLQITFYGCFTDFWTQSQILVRRSWTLHLPPSTVTSVWLQYGVLHSAVTHSHAESHEKLIRIHVDDCYRDISCHDVVLLHQ